MDRRYVRDAESERHALARTLRRPLVHIIFSTQGGRYGWAYRSDGRSCDPYRVVIARRRPRTGGGAALCPRLLNSIPAGCRNAALRAAGARPVGLPERGPSGCRSAAWR